MQGFRFQPRCFQLPPPPSWRWMGGFHFKLIPAAGMSAAFRFHPARADAGCRASHEAFSFHRPELALDGRLPLPAAGPAGRLDTGGLGAAALLGGSSDSPGAAAARLAFFICSFWPMIGGWPRASR